MAARVAYLVHGYLGAGKTTFATTLAARAGALRYSPDDLMVERHGHDPPAAHFDGYLERIYAELNLAWPRTLGEGRDVVLDFGFWTRAWRDDARARARAAFAQTKLFFVRCSEAVALARCLERNLAPGKSLYVSDNTFELLKVRFEPLAADDRSSSSKRKLASGRTEAVSARRARSRGAIVLWAWL